MVFKKLYIKPIRKSTDTKNCVFFGSELGNNADGIKWKRPEHFGEPCLLFPSLSLSSPCVRNKICLCLYQSTVIPLQFTVNSCVAGIHVTRIPSSR